MINAEQWLPADAKLSVRGRQQELFIHAPPAGMLRQAVRVRLLRCYQEVLHMDIQKLAQRVKIIHVRQ